MHIDIAFAVGIIVLHESLKIQSDPRLFSARLGWSPFCLEYLHIGKDDNYLELANI